MMWQSTHCETDRELDELDLMRLAQRDGIEMHKWESALAAAAIKAQISAAIDSMRGKRKATDDTPDTLCRSAAGWLEEIGVDVNHRDLLAAVREVAGR